MTSTDSSITAWLRGRLPDAWTTTPAEIAVDRDEITILLTIAEPELGDDASPADRAEAVAGRVSGFREERATPGCRLLARPNIASNARSRGVFVSAVRRRCSPISPCRS